MYEYLSNIINDVVDKRHFLMVIAYFIAGIGFGISPIFQAFKYIRTSRMLKITPTSKIKGLAMGLVELSGIAVACGKVMKSPITQTPCVYYSYIVEKVERSSNHFFWTDIDDDRSDKTFYIEDETGRVLVCPDEAEMKIPFQTVIIPIKNRSYNENIQHYWRYGHRSGKKMNWSKAKYCKYIEQVIRPGDKLFVLGTATRNKEVRHQKTNEDAIVIRKGEGESDYFITSLGQNDTIKRFGWNIALNIASGVITSTFFFGMGVYTLVDLLRDK